MPIHSHPRRGSCAAVAIATALLACHRHGPSTASAFSHPSRGAPRASPAAPPSFPSPPARPRGYARRPRASALPAAAAPGPTFEKLADDDDRVVAFLEVDGENGIDCYVDGRATVGGVDYAIGIPCDYAVALCYVEDAGALVPVELDDPRMDAVFPVAEEIIEDEFGEELVLVRTPQTLTLVGELEEGEVDGEDGDDSSDGGDDTEEEVEILVSFEEDDREYHLVRLLDPVLLVGKAGDIDDTRILLTPEESDMVMPQLEKLVLSYQEKQN